MITSKYDKTCQHYTHSVIFRGERLHRSRDLERGKQCAKMVDRSPVWNSVLWGRGEVGVMVLVNRDIDVLMVVVVVVVVVIVVTFVVVFRNLIFSEI